MTCRECENAPTRLCVACYEREQYGEQGRDWRAVLRLRQDEFMNADGRVVHRSVPGYWTSTRKAPPKESL